VATLVGALVTCCQCCHSMLTRFPYNKNEKSPHFPAQAETKNAIIFSYNIWPWNTTYYIRCIIKCKIKITCIKLKQVYRKHHCITTCQFFSTKSSQCLLRLASTFGNKSKHNLLQLSSWLHSTRKVSLTLHYDCSFHCIVLVLQCFACWNRLGYTL